ncbi:MAG: hypothetical protein IJU40_04405, partial [Desulfovibrionaceae bacterium]|nr:hypothetical protein [Desulfovibrionaceae bacterium]
HAIEQKLNKLNKVVHGKAHWVLVAQDKSYDFETIDKLMQTFRQLIHGEKLEEEPNLPFLQHRKKKTL